MEEATKYNGWPYVWGGSSPSTSFDCSGFVCWVYIVSYTHLDVYKRQASISDQLKAGKAAAEQAKAERPPKEKPSRGAAVSYTHLDVYKRQV